MSQKLIRYTLGTLLAFGALNAFAGGYYAIAGAEGVPLEWLRGSPFTNYRIPGLILFVVVGGAFLTASIAVFANAHSSKAATYGAVAIVGIWLLVQVSTIGYVSWMQPTTAIVSLIMLSLGIALNSNQRPSPNRFN